MKYMSEARLELDGFSELVTARNAVMAYADDKNHPTANFLADLFELAVDGRYSPKVWALEGEEANFVIASLRDHLTHPDANKYHSIHARYMLGLEVRPDHQSTPETYKPITQYESEDRPDMEAAFDTQLIIIDEAA